MYCLEDWVDGPRSFSPVKSRENRLIDLAWLQIHKVVCYDISLSELKDLSLSYYLISRTYNLICGEFFNANLRWLSFINIWGNPICKIFVKYTLSLGVRRLATSLNSISSNPLWAQYSALQYICNCHDWKKTLRTSNNLSVRFLSDSTRGWDFLFLSLILLLLFGQVKRILWATFSELNTVHQEYYEYSKVHCGAWIGRCVLREMEMICPQGPVFIITFAVVTLSQISCTFKPLSFSCEYWLTSVENPLDSISQSF